MAHTGHAGAGESRGGGPVGLTWTWNTMSNCSAGAAAGVAGIALSFFPMVGCGGWRVSRGEVSGEVRVGSDSDYRITAFYAPTPFLSIYRTPFFIWLGHFVFMIIQFHRVIIIRF